MPGRAALPGNAGQRRGGAGSAEPGGAQGLPAGRPRVPPLVKELSVPGKGRLQRWHRSRESLAAARWRSRSRALCRCREPASSVIAPEESSRGPALLRRICCLFSLAYKLLIIF